MDIRIRVDQTFEEFYHVHMLMAGRTGFYKYASLATQIFFMFLLLISAVVAILRGISAYGVILFAFLIVMMCAVFVIQNFIFPRRLKKIFLQFKNIAEEQEYRFTDDGVAAKDRRGESSIPWGKYLKWAEDETMLVLFQTDNMINFIPKRFLTQEQTGEIRQAVTAAKIPVLKVSRIGTVLWMIIVIFGLTPVVCWLIAWSVYAVVQSLAGY